MKKRIVYEDIPVATGTFVVDELSFVDLVRKPATKQLLGVIMEAYVAQYAPAVMAEADIRAKYDPENPDNVARYRSRALHHYLHADSQFFIGRTTAEPNRILSLAKISDGPKSDDTAEPGSIYLNDIIAIPPWRKGIGAATAHAAFKFGGHSDAPLLLEGFVGSSVNEWYINRWGLVPGEQSEQFHVGGAQEQYFRSPEGHTLGDIAVRFETHNPALSSARLE